MKRSLIISAAAVLTLALTVPAFAGGAGCADHAKASAASADAKASCAAKATAWSGAWLQYSPSGQVIVMDVAKSSPASKSGLKTGDIVLAVNGYDLSNNEDRAMCVSKADCRVGSAVTYKVQRGASTKSLKFTLAKVPSSATARFASRQATFDPALAAAVIPASN